MKGVIFKKTCVVRLRMCDTCAISARVDLVEVRYVNQFALGQENEVGESSPK